MFCFKSRKGNKRRKFKIPFNLAQIEADCEEDRAGQRERDRWRETENKRVSFIWTQDFNN